MGLTLNDTLRAHLLPAGFSRKDPNTTMDDDGSCSPEPAAIRKSYSRHGLRHTGARLCLVLFCVPRAVRGGDTYYNKQQREEWF